MSKALVILAVAVIAVVSVPGQPDPDKATGNKEQSIAKPQATAMSSDNANKQASTQTNQSKPTPVPTNWYTFLQRPEWCLVIVAIVTGVLVGWQSWATLKAAKATEASAKATEDSAKATEDSAKAMSRSVELQEVQYKQWVELRDWRTSGLAPIQPNVDETRLTLAFQVRNSTKFPLTLKRLTTRKGTGSSASDTICLIAPEGSYSAFFSFEATPAELELYKRNMLTVMLTVEVVIKDVLERECDPQHFTRTITFGPTRCDVVDHPLHFQLIAKLVSKGTAPEESHKLS